MAETHTLRWGLTGGIGSGKSTVADLLAKLGASVIDADAIARAVSAPGGAAIAPLRETFGAQFITPQGALDRDQMRALVFRYPAAKARLEAIIHPLVSQQIWLQAEAAMATGSRHLVFDVPLLVESAHWRQKVDRVLVVDCTTQTQIDRVMARNGMAQSQVQAILVAQATRTQRAQAADAVIFNDGISLEELARQVKALAQRFGLSSPHPSAPEPLA